MISVSIIAIAYRTGVKRVRHSIGRVKWETTYIESGRVLKFEHRAFAVVLLLSCFRCRALDVALDLQLLDLQLL